MNVSLETAQATKCMAYLKNRSLYLLSEDNKRLVSVIYTKYFLASRIAGTGTYCFGLELANAGFEGFKHYYLYSNDEGEISHWVQAINACSDFAKFEAQYSVFEEIAKGQFSTVYRCAKRGTKTEYVVKQIVKERLNSKERDLLQNEMAIVAELCHSCIPEYVAVVEDKSVVYIVAERVKGVTLQEYLASCKRMAEPEAAFVLYTLLKTLCYIHKIGIIHRDLKPGNILVELLEDTVAIAKLIDFGFAALVEPDEKLFDACGAPAYVAPEVLRRQGYNSRADLWSLGVVAHSM